MICQLKFLLFIYLTAEMQKYFSAFCCCCCSIGKLCLTLRPHGMQHTRLPCPSPSPRVYSNSCPLSQWYHPTISSPVIPFSSCPSIFPSIRVFTLESVFQFFASGVQSIGASASASVLLMTIQAWFPLGWTGLTSLLPRDSQQSSPTPQFKSINSSCVHESKVVTSGTAEHRL